MFAQHKKQVLYFFLTLLLFFSPFDPSLLYAMGKVKKEGNSKGVLYFSEGHRLSRLNLAFSKKGPVEEQPSKPIQEIFPQLPRGNYSALTYLASLRKLIFFNYYTGKFECLSGDLSLGEAKVLFDFPPRSKKHAFSLDEKWLAFFRSVPERKHKTVNVGGEPLLFQSAQLVVRNFSTGEEFVLVDEVPTNPGPSPLWISEKKLLYVDWGEELVEIHIETKEKKSWGIKHLAPMALSPDRRKILCTENGWSSTVYLLDVKKRSLKQITKAYPLLGNTLIWSPDSRSFIFSRPESPNSWGPDEPFSLYWFHLKTGKEKMIARSFLLNSGVWLNEDPFGK